MIGNTTQMNGNGNGSITRHSSFPDDRRVPVEVACVFPHASSATHDLLAPQHARLEQESDPNGMLTVRYQLSLGVSPRLYIEWQADQGWLDAGGRVAVFRNVTGFAPLFNAIPLDHVSHGEQTVDTNRNDFREWQVREGDIYVTVMLVSPTAKNVFARAKANLRGRFTGSRTRVAAFLRFAVSVPGATSTIERIEQDARLHEAQERDLRAREKLARRSNQSNRQFEVERHGRRIEIETEKRISEYMRIQQCFTNHRRELSRDRSLSKSEREAAMDQLDALMRAQLSAANFPFLDARE